MSDLRLKKTAFNVVGCPGPLGGVANSEGTYGRVVPPGLVAVPAGLGLRHGALRDLLFWLVAILKKNLIDY